ncbi:hypothetical protein KY285_030226 [Solanum tuberosum]|nr:hypothetical protein KY285_030226 [Solanum tuberosum]
MSQRASSMATTQSFASVTSSYNIKCSSCLCGGCEQQHEYFISRISQPLKCRRLKKSISRSLSIFSNRKELVTAAPVSSSIAKGKGKEKEKEKEDEEEEEKQKEKEKEKEKKTKKVVSCDVKKQQRRFEAFNIAGKGQTELMSSFSQWINEGLYKHYARK